MSKLEDLEQFYTKDLREPLLCFDRTRKVIQWKTGVQAVALVPFNVMVFLVMDGNEKSLAAFTTVGSLVWLAYFMLSREIRWAKDFKTTIIPRLLERIEPSLDYSPEGQIDSRVFHQSCLYEFSQMYDYDGEDFVTGNLAGVSVSFCELRVTSGGSKNGTTTHFRGMFLVAQVKIEIDDPVWLLPPDYVRRKDKLGLTGRMLSGVLDRMNQREGEKITIEDEEFMKCYSVVTEKEDAAARILSKDLRQKLIDLQSRSGKEVRVSFQNNQIAVALSTDGGHFEPHLTESALSYKVARRFAEDVSHALRVILAIGPVAR